MMKQMGCKAVIFMMLGGEEAKEEINWVMMVKGNNTKKHWQMVVYSLLKNVCGGMWDVG